MFDWWVRLDEQTVRIENSATYKEILHWGAKPRDTRSQTDMELSFTSVKDPTRLINRLKAKGAITDGEIFSLTQTVKPRRNPIKKPADKTKTSAELKDRLGKTLGGKP